MCDGPLEFIGNSVKNLEILPPNKRSIATFSKVEIPYATKLFDQELTFDLNIGMRFLTDHDVTRLRGAPLVRLTVDQQREALTAVLPERMFSETNIPERLEPKKEIEVSPDDLSALGATDDYAPPVNPVNTRVLNAAVEAAVNAAVKNSNSGKNRLQSDAVSAAVNAAISAANAINAPPDDFVANTQNFNIPLEGMNFSVAPQEESLGEPLGEDDYNELEPLPQLTQPLPQATQPTQQTGGGNNTSSQVNIQTASRPVLVVPMNVTQQPSAAQRIASPAPGAPATYAIDTGSSLMNSIGLESGPSRKRSTSPSAPRVSNTTAFKGGAQSNTNPNVKVNVVKED